jgi:hypothetical protein
VFHLVVAEVAVLLVVVLLLLGPNILRMGREQTATPSITYETLQGSLGEVLSALGAGERNAFYAHLFSGVVCAPILAATPLAMLAFLLWHLTDDQGEVYVVGGTLLFSLIMMGVGIYMVVGFRRHRLARAALARWATRNGWRAHKGGYVAPPPGVCAVCLSRNPDENPPLLDGFTFLTAPAPGLVRCAKVLHKLHPVADFEFVLDSTFRSLDRS